ncbi:AAA family ATPase [Pseudoalteromonas sp. SG43-1]|uniref:AAA family ATPase n=1 Tax=Pseudoalteromonas sp. SG43-1 TaxID=2760971 RepID=UPI001603E337|nr:AAA family ATPase [Pseudoalteromonas sp. SG43-1]MBB1452473.1 AAA family ATPase [Pseudoalteromonas sp. SG43-1]
MAKRNKARKQPVAANATNPSNSAADKIDSALAAVDNLTESDNGTILGAMAEKLKLAKTSHDAASEEQKKEASESYGNDIQTLVGELKKLVEQNKKTEADNKQSLLRSKQLEESVEELKKKIELEKKELDKQSKELLTNKKKNAEDRAEIANKLEELKEQELDAESGFAAKHMEMLESFEEKQNKLRESLEEKRLKLEKEVDELTKAKQSLNEAEKVLLEEKLQELSCKEAKLDEKEFQLNQEKTLIERKRKQAQLTNDEASIYKASLKGEIEQEFIYQISSLENQKENLEKQIAQYDLGEKQLLAKLSSFKDIERQFGDDTPQEVLEQLNHYKQTVNKLLLELDEKPSEQLEQNYKVLKKTYEALEQECNNAHAELQQNKVQLTKSRMSVIDLEQVEKQKQALLKHNQLLQTYVDQLSEDVDDLINKQQAKAAFPALLELDSRLRAKGITETVPSLTDFAKDLQHRIAWDADEQKELYYRLEDIWLFIAGLSMSRLHILQGISGTGKTSLAKAFARAVGGGVKTISVQAGWRDKGDLIGHFNAFEKKFYEQETLQALYEAQSPAYSDRPYIVLLDEMNLSRPEQYFAEFLSALELDPKDRILTLMTTGQPNGPEKLIDGRKIKIPENLWFIGTANHDETTFEFADKTYDRAHVMELPRHKNTFEINKDLEPVTYSFDSLEAAFEAAANKHNSKVTKLIKELDGSELSMILEEEFNVSWGNRLERHFVRFIPVMLECGSDLGFALDHMLATKVLRAGKATGRYDTEHEDISNLIDALNDFWRTQGFNSKPEACLKLLNNELKKKSSL